MTTKEIFKNISAFFCICFYIVCAVDVIGYAVYHNVTACAICGGILALMALPFVVKCVKKVLHGDL